MRYEIVLGFVLIVVANGATAGGHPSIMERIRNSAEEEVPFEEPEEIPRAKDINGAIGLLKQGSEAISKAAEPIRQAFEHQIAETQFSLPNLWNGSETYVLSSIPIYIAWMHYKLPGLLAATLFVHGVLRVTHVQGGVLWLLSAAIFLSKTKKVLAGICGLGCYMLYSYSIVQRTQSN